MEKNFVVETSPKNYLFFIVLKLINLYFLKLLMEIVRNLDKFRSNAIFLEKSKWIETRKIESYDQMNFWSNNENFAEKLKIVTFKRPQLDETLTLNKIDLSRFKNLEHIELSFKNITSIENTYFNTFSNLSYLKLDCELLEDLPQVLFSGLTQLKALDLQLNGKAILNKNHFIELGSLKTLKLSHVVLEGDLEILVNLKELELKNVEFDNFSFNGLENLETLKLKDLKASLKWLKFGPTFFKNLKKLKHLQVFNFINQTLDMCTSKIEKIYIIKQIFKSVPSSVFAKM